MSYQKYKINFVGKRKVFMGFITADFYDEINLPQHRGMLSFFDFSYVSKPRVPYQKIKNLSQIINDLNKIFKKS